MKLTLQTDFAMRILISLAQEPEQLVSVQELADRYCVSKNHLMKTAQLLVANGYVESIRGRNGGIRLALPAKEIEIGRVVRLMEPNFHIAECFQKGGVGKQCALLPNCKLKGLLGDALLAFLKVLDNKTLADLIR